VCVWVGLCARGEVCVCVCVWVYVQEGKCVCVCVGLCARGEVCVCVCGFMCKRGSSQAGIVSGVVV